MENDKPKCRSRVKKRDVFELEKKGFINYQISIISAVCQQFLTDQIIDI